MVERGTVDLCLTDPGHEVDVFVRGSLRTMTAVWMGYTSLRSEMARGALEVDGPSALVSATSARGGVGRWSATRPASAR